MLLEFKLPSTKISIPREKTARGRRPGGVTPGREALLRVALVHFAKRGYEATSLRSLAAQAGVDVALVARLFGSKAKLWVAVIDQLAATQAPFLDQLRHSNALGEQDPREAMQSLIQYFANLSFEIPAFVAFLMHEMTNPGERMNIVLQRLVAPFRLACTPVIAAAIKAGHVRAADPDLFFGMLIAAISLPMGAPGIVGRGMTLTAKLRDEIVHHAERMVLLPV